jgi:serine/threonine protein kinase
MSPEQSRGEQADFRSDLFSFGCVLYRLCTGLIPFQGRNHTDVLAALALEEPLPVDQLNPKVPRALSALVMQLLEKEPEDRPPSAKAVLARLRKIKASRHTGTAPHGPSAKRRGNRPSGRRKRPAPRRRWLHRCLALLLGLTVGITAAYFVRAGLRAADFIPAQPAAEAGR